jgi:hypothetical protein
MIAISGRRFVHLGKMFGIVQFRSTRKRQGRLSPGVRKFPITTDAPKRDRYLRLLVMRQTFSVETGH